MSHTPLSLIPFTTEEITGCTKEAAKGANKAPRNLPSCSFISYLTVSVTPSIDTPESSNDYIILMISFISSFLYLAGPFPLIFLSNLFIVLELKLPTNPGKLSLAKITATLVSTFFLNLLTKNKKINLIELFQISEL